MQKILKGNLITKKLKLLLLSQRQVVKVRVYFLRETLIGFRLENIMLLKDIYISRI